MSSGTTEVSPDNTHLNTASATTTVTDVTPPTITSCLNPVALSCTADIPAKDAASIVATDNCTTSGSLTKAWVSDVKSNETCTNRYTLTRTYSVTDASSNIATCTQIITVNDQTPPSISCPGPVEVSCASLIPAAATDYATFVGQGGTASDNCTGACYDYPRHRCSYNQSCGNRYTLTRTYRATDLCGNSTDCKQVITIKDETAPTFTNPDDVSISCDASTDRFYGSSCYCIRQLWRHQQYGHLHRCNHTG